MKAIVKATGEIIDVRKNDEGLYIQDTEPKQWRKHHEIEILGYTVEEVKEIKACLQRKLIDWEQRRYEIAKELMKGFAANPHNQCVDADTETLAQWSVGGADALINGLKKRETQ